MQRRMSAGRLCTWAIMSGVLLGGAWMGKGWLERYGQPRETPLTQEEVIEHERLRLGSSLTYCAANPRVIQIGCDLKDGQSIGLGFFVQQEDGEINFATAMHVVEEGQCIIAPWANSWYPLDTVTRGAARPDAAVFAIPESAAPDGALIWANREPIIGETVTVYLWTGEDVNEVSATITHREWLSGFVCWAIDTDLRAGSSGGPVIASDGTVLGVMACADGSRSFFYDAPSFLKLEDRRRAFSELQSQLEPQMRASAEARHGRDLMLEGKHAEAMPILRSAVAADPRDEEAADWLAESLMAEGKASEAIKILEATTALLGEDASLAPNQLVLAYVLDGNASGAIALADRLLASGRIDWSVGEIMLNSSASRETLRRRREYPQTRKILSRLIELLPLHCDFYEFQSNVGLKSNARAMPSAYCIERSVVCRDMAIGVLHARDANSQIAEIIDTYGEEGLSSFSLWQAGGALQAVDRASEGVRLVERAWSLDPDDYSIATILGRYFRDNEDHGRAAAYFAIACEAVQSASSLHADTALHMMSRCTWEQIEPIYNLLPPADSDAKDADIYNRAKVLHMTGNTVRALELIEAREWIEEPVLLHFACVIADDLGDLDLALMYARLTLEADPDNPELREWIEQYN